MLWAQDVLTMPIKVGEEMMSFKMRYCMMSLNRCLEADFETEKSSSDGLRKV